LNEVGFSSPSTTKVPLKFYDDSVRNWLEKAKISESVSFLLNLVAKLSKYSTSSKLKAKPSCLL
jgi:ribosomal protein S16